VNVVLVDNLNDVMLVLGKESNASFLCRSAIAFACKRKSGEESECQLFLCCWDYDKNNIECFRYNVRCIRSILQNGRSLLVVRTNLCELKS